MVLILTESPSINNKSVVRTSSFLPIKSKEVDQGKLMVIFHETLSGNNSHYWHIVSGQETPPPPSPPALPPTFL